MSTIEYATTGAQHATGVPAIAVTDLIKTYRFHQKEPGLRGSLLSLVRRRTLENRAVDGISFSINRGEVVGFLGPNGAGKTTTLKMLCGLLYPDGGHVDVLGYTPARREPAFLRRISLVMGQKNMLAWDIPALETLFIHKEMYRLSPAGFWRNVNDLAALLDVGHLLRVQVRKLSLGERMKMELLAALVHRPDVLFLDEPTIGLDVVAQQRVRDFLRHLNAEQGTTILLTSHDMDDIEALCPRVLIIDHGHLCFDGALTTLVESVAADKVVRVVYTEPVPAPALTAALDGATLRPTDDPLRIDVTLPRAHVARIASRLLTVGNVADLSIQETPVEDIIRKIFTTGVTDREVV